MIVEYKLEARDSNVVTAPGFMSDSGHYMEKDRLIGYYGNYAVVLPKGINVLSRQDLIERLLRIRAAGGMLNFNADPSIAETVMTDAEITAEVDKRILDWRTRFEDGMGVEEVKERRLKESKRIFSTQIKSSVTSVTLADKSKIVVNASREAKDNIYSLWTIMGTTGTITLADGSIKRNVSKQDIEAIWKGIVKHGEMLFHGKWLQEKAITGSKTLQELLKIAV